MIPEAVKHYARRMDSNAYPADDLVQDAAVAIINAGGLRLTEAQRTVIGRNAIVDQMRKLRVRRKALAEMPEHHEPASYAPGPLAEVVASDLRERLEDGQDLRTLWVVTGLTCGFTKSETAARYGLSKPMVSRIVKQLRRRAERLAS